ncbi:MFS transporter [Metabacillus litoralis]|uniref:MFS transporter n=1 Tax=Metabacillus litoralis TaxID=152268 RepID=UPI00203A66C6|nr:MFS transporter [Metabacillus litoralis]MCM3409214.1 MFS transporter [Metabacillus litoralis]
MIELLKDKTYLRYWLAVVVSFLGDAMTITTVLFLIGTTVENPLLIGFVFVAQLLPAVILGPLIGPLIDKYSSRKMMIFSDVFRCFMVLSMILFVDKPLVLICLTLLQGIGTAFFEPARMASIPIIVGINRIPSGIALFQTTVAVIKLVGPVLAGLLLAFQSPSLVFILDASSYIISACLIFSLKILKAQKKDHNTNSYFNSLWTGVREMIKTPILLFMILLLFPVLIGYGMFLTNYKAVLLQYFQVSNIEFGILEGIFAFGTVIGAIVGSYAMKKIVHYQLLYIAIGTLGLGVVSVYGIIKVDIMFSQSVFFILGGWSFITGLANALLMVPTSSIFLLHLPEAIRGRGTAIFYSIFNLFLLAGTLLGGFIASSINILVALILSGGILLITTISYPIYKNTSLMRKVKKQL